MSVILNGKPEPRFVLRDADGVVVEDFTLGCFKSENFTFEPDIIRHVLQSRRIKWKLRGFRMKVVVDFENVQGEKLQVMHKLLDRRAYASCDFYPFATDKPFFFERISLDDDDIELAYESILLHKRFSLRIVSERLLDYVPMEDADFITWGNITLQFTDLATLPYTSYMRTVTLSKTGTGTITGETSGFFKDGATETIGGSKSTSAANVTFETDVMTTCQFTASGGTFVKWQIDGVDVPAPRGTQPVLHVTITAATTITAVFT